MPQRITYLVNGETYHVFNRGTNKKNIFLVHRDYERFLQTLTYYQLDNIKQRFSFRFKDQIKEDKPDPNDKLLEFFGYCLMPNHVHFLVRQLKENGIFKFMQKASNSYAKYFNVKYRNSGPLFENRFKAVRIESEEQLVHVSRYIHLNPVVVGLVKSIDDYPWSSFFEYTDIAAQRICLTNEILEFFPSKEGYRRFVEDQTAYGQALELIKHQVIEEL